MKPNFYKCYHVTEDGKIYNTNTGKQLKYSQVRGYLRYTLYDEGSRHQWQAHRLVATVYLENPEHKPCVNHKDGDKHNNTVDNLEWCTYSENEEHSFKVLGKEPNRPCKLTQEQVDFIRNLPDRKEVTLRPVAESFGVSYWTVRDVAFFRNWK